MAETTTVEWKCLRCGQPINEMLATYIGSHGPYHNACATTPAGYFTPPPLTAEEVRQIVREELRRALGGEKGEGRNG